MDITLTFTYLKYMIIFTTKMHTKTTEKISLGNIYTISYWTDDNHQHLD